MVVLYIILGILAAVIVILVVLLHFSVKAYISADKKHVDIDVKYLGFKLYSLSVPEKEKPPEESPPEEIKEPEIEFTELELTDSTSEDDLAEIHKKIEESSVQDSPADNAEPPQGEPKEPEDDSTENDEPEEKKPKPSLLDMWNEYKKYIPAGKKAFRKLLKLIRFRDLNLSLTVGNDDPYKAGLNFGRINAAVYSVLGFLCTVFSVTIDKTEIKCDFENKTTDFSVSTAIFVRPSAVIALAVYLGIYYLKIRNSMKKLEKQAFAKENSK